ncbi:hypothetical protein SBA5_30077 [Candidatus Sulfotelmatomonas gaucii]|uniref:Uncharacterized protein n=1 Tax=Candidatus Sulfuritelmatomonas gaucii TaxID=2043161 RepID=A0A2N9LC61_9BACT|nr:hypothetical protein SBA5_30077 [Candidatus Sulfotelmatomonas gaucii]
MIPPKLRSGSAAGEQARAILAIESCVARYCNNHSVSFGNQVTRAGWSPIALSQTRIESAKFL